MINPQRKHCILFPETSTTLRATLRVKGKNYLNPLEPIITNFVLPLN